MSTVWRSLLLLAGALLVTSPSMALADPCDQAALAAAQGGFGYSRHGDYCEGLFAGQVSGGMDVLSVTAGPIASEGEQEIQEIRVKPNAGIAPLHLVAISRSPTILYRLDKELDPAVPFSWDSSRLTAKTSLVPTEIGFMAFRGANGGDTVVPVCVGATDSACAGANKLYVVVRPSSNLNALDALVSRRRAGKWDAGQLLHLAPSGYAGGIPATLAVNIQDHPDAVRVDFSGIAFHANAATNPPKSIDYATHVIVELKSD